MNTKKGNVTKAECFQELIRKLLHKEVELEEVNGVGLPNESAEKPRKASISATTDNRQMVV